MLFFLNKKYVFRPINSFLSLYTDGKLRFSTFLLLETYFLLRKNNIESRRLTLPWAWQNLNVGWALLCQLCTTMI
jgi:hypothetical protein